MNCFRVCSIALPQALFPVIIATMMNGLDKLESGGFARCLILSVATNSGFNLSSSRVYVQGRTMLSIIMHVIAMICLQPGDFDNNGLFPFAILPIFGIILSIIPLPKMIVSLVSSLSTFTPLLMYMTTKVLQGDATNDVFTLLSVAPTALTLAVHVASNGESVMNTIGKTGCFALYLLLIVTAQCAAMFAAFFMNYGTFLPVLVAGSMTSDLTRSFQLAQKSNSSKNELWSTLGNDTCFFYNLFLICYAIGMYYTFNQNMFQIMNNLNLEKVLAPYVTFMNPFLDWLASV